jgi:DNA-binding NarL/FixJ family response regulator
VIVNAEQIASLRAQGRSWAEIAAEAGVGQGTVRRAVKSLAESLSTGVAARTSAALQS